MNNFHTFPQSNNKQQNFHHSNRFSQGVLNSNQIFSNQNTNFETGIMNRNVNSRNNNNIGNNVSIHSPYTNIISNFNNSKFIHTLSNQSNDLENNCTVEVIGFTNETFNNIIELMKSFGKISKYYHKTKSNFMILKYSSELDALNSIKFFENPENVRIYGVRVFYNNNEDVILDNFDKFKKRSDTTEANGVNSEDNEEIRIPQINIFGKILINLFPF